ncbi:MAG: hypothetical protein QM528_01000 [Phycisphaerales bacterium]|nr:hypothetical protein [Phycisphaerales bacterium]
MKLLLSSLLLLCVLVGQSTTVKVVNWNLEWFGSNTAGPLDKAQQNSNVLAICKELNADLYAFCEVVDTNRFKDLVHHLGSKYNYAWSSFCSGAENISDKHWANGQKLAFVYNKNIFKHVTVRGMMVHEHTAYYNFANGRLPFLLSALVTINKKNVPISFILIHGKAGNSYTSYYRRFYATDELVDTLSLYFSNQLVCLLGDFNDDLLHTISYGVKTNESSYLPLEKWSQDHHDYWHFLTEQLSARGQKSTTHYNSVIDNQVVSSPLFQYYVPNSIQIDTVVGQWVSDETLEKTSDHYPVVALYNW